MPTAKTAAEQHAAMLRMMERAMALAPLQRMGTLSDIAAAQLTLNGMIIDELAHTIARLGAADHRRALADDVLRDYIADAVSAGLVPADVANEFLHKMERIEHGN